MKKVAYCLLGFFAIVFLNSCTEQSLDNGEVIQSTSDSSMSTMSNASYSVNGEDPYGQDYYE